MVKLSPQAKFNKLLEQINYTSPDLQAGQVDEVVVHKQSRVWELHLAFPHILPAATYQGFFQALRVSFYQLAQANVDLSIKTSDEALDEKLIADYWRPLVTQALGQTTMTAEIADRVLPKLVDQRVMVPLANEKVKEFVEKRFFPPLMTAYQKAGFPVFTLHATVDTEKSAARAKELQERRKQQDAELVKKAMAQMEANKAKATAANSRSILNL